MRIVTAPLGSFVGEAASARVDMGGSEGVSERGEACVASAAAGGESESLAALSAEAKGVAARARTGVDESMPFVPGAGAGGEASAAVTAGLADLFLLRVASSASPFAAGRLFFPPFAPPRSSTILAQHSLPRSFIRLASFNLGHNPVACAGKLSSNLSRSSSSISSAKNEVGVAAIAGEASTRARGRSSGSSRAVRRAVQSGRAEGSAAATQGGVAATGMLGEAGWRAA